MTKNISNWGNYPVQEAEEHSFTFENEAVETIKKVESVIPRGNGRCYGDASLSQNIISTLKYDKIIGFNPDKGEINCESGITLDKILDFIIPHGWFLPVTPGTKYITVGGALSSDVHGKNHHKEGTFADHVSEFSILLASGEIVKASQTNNWDLFRATAGGMGLTGVILTVKFRLKKINSTSIIQRKIKAKNLTEAVELFNQYQNYTYSMAWIDCLSSKKKLGRSLIMLGEHADSDGSEQILKPDHDQKINMPVYLPSFTLNNLSIRTFNWLYYHKELRKDAVSSIRYDSFFYPLDSITNWNRMYGKPGFVQYQFVLPLESSLEGMTEILKRISAKGMGSFLAVLKLFGPENDNYISFPKEGYTLALDFPVKSKLFPFLDELDSVVLDFGGRIYLSKDARMDYKIFESSYPRLNEFMQTVKKFNPGKYESIQSERLFKLK